MSSWSNANAVMGRMYQYAGEMTRDLADVLTPLQVAELEKRWFTPKAEVAAAVEAQAIAAAERLLFEAGLSAEDARAAMTKAKAEMDARRAAAKAEER